MEKRNFLAFALSVFLICVAATVFVACEQNKADKNVNKPPITEQQLIHGDLPQPNEDDYIIGLPLIDSYNDDITAEVLEVTNTSIKFKLDTSVSDIWTGEPYSIEVYNKDGFWQSAPTTVPEDEIAWIMPAYMIPGEFTHDWSYLYGKLPAGEYRLVKQISGEIEVPYVWVYFTVEEEKYPKSFAGTIIEEEPTHIIIEPNKDEEESELYSKIEITFPKAMQARDYIYGDDRKVVITYNSPINDGKLSAEATEIRTDGYSDFSLSVKYSDGHTVKLCADTKEIDKYNPDYSLYYYGLDDVYFTYEDGTVPLYEALMSGKITTGGILSYCNKTIENPIEYKDGGSVEYNFGDFKIIKYHTLDGYRDMFIGTTDMNMDVRQMLRTMITGVDKAQANVKAVVTDVTRTSIMFSLEGDEGLYTDDRYSIQRLNGNVWENVPLATEQNHSCIVVSHNLPNSFTHDWSSLYGQLSAGKYRLEKSIFSLDSGFSIYLYFEIQPDKPGTKIHKSDLYVKNHISDYTKDSDYPETIDISEEDAKKISEILQGADWTEFVYDGSEPILDYYHIWAEGYVIDYFMNEGKFEGVDYSKTTTYSSVFPANRLRLVLTEEQKEIVDGIVGKYFVQPSRINCY